MVAFLGARRRNHAHRLGAQAEASDRLNTTLTLILTQVAFKQVASSSIPHVNYLTCQSTPNPGPPPVTP